MDIGHNHGYNYKIDPSLRGAVDNLRCGNDDKHRDSDDLIMNQNDLGLDLLEVEEDQSSMTKFGWLRSQMIGGDLDFETPFGKRRLVYADHTASGRSLHYIENYILKNVLPFYGNTHTSDSHVGRKTTKMMREASEYIKKCLGGGLNDALLFCGSGTTAAIKRLQEVMGIWVPSTLRDRILNHQNLIRNEERWLVFLGPYEHHSNLLSWHQSLAEVIEIGMDNDGLVDMEALRLQLEFYKSSNRPMLGSFSACSNVTGIVADTRAMARLLHQYGAFACFDFAASGPYVEIDMRSGNIDGYDAIFLSPHKFLGGPGSPGILMMNKVLYELRSSPPSTCGGGTVTYVNNFDAKDTLYYDDIEEREEAGTPPIIQKVRAALAFWVKEYIGYNLIEKQEEFYIQTALKRLLPNPNIWVLGNTSVKRQAILSFLIFPARSSSSPSLEDDMKNPHTSTTTSTPIETRRGLYMVRESGKPLHGPFVAKLLNDLFGIQARGGCACAGPYGHHLLGVDEPLSLAFRSAIQKGYVGIKPGWTRISFPYYMSKEEFDFILSALEFIAIYGDRFLPLYSFSWKTGQWTFRRRSIKDNLVWDDQKLVQLIDKLSLISPKHPIKPNNNGRSNGENKSVTNEPAKKTSGEIIISNFSMYLETAKNIANSLSKFTRQRRIPNDIDQNLVYFRV
ncbi:Aminotransferase [Macleaya cordata]|uniref:Aminotransferase n=1 Tax=Macleaya cordata TaxID=56857 RepID=A0A200PUW3_MACCD|nr:Aminotransferase [Macleaya cordata]